MCIRDRSKLKMRAQRTADAEEFPFVEELPKAIVAEAAVGLAAMRRVLAEYQEATAQHGPVVPITTVAEQLGVTKQAVMGLIDRGRIEAVEVCGRRWVIGSTVLRYLEEGPKKGGRPRKLTTAGNTVRLGVELAATAQGVMK